MKFKIGDTVRNVGQPKSGPWVVDDIVDYDGGLPADSGKSYKLIDENGQVTYLLLRHEDTMELREEEK